MEIKDLLHTYRSILKGIDKVIQKAAEEAHAYSIIEDWDDEEYAKEGMDRIKKAAHAHINTFTTTDVDADTLKEIRSYAKQTVNEYIDSQS